MDYLKICKKYREAFEKEIRNVDLEARGMLPSEVLLIYSVAKELGIKQIYESGRARGYSTYVLAKTLPKIPITSIDFDKHSKDTRYAKKRLAEFENVELTHGNAMKILPEMISQKSVVVIDSPKGEMALVLAANLLKNAKVKAVFIHDLSRDLFERTIAQQLFPGAYHTDNKKHVKEFSDLDNGYSNSGESYGGPLTMILNEKGALDTEVIKQYIQYYDKERNVLRKALKNQIESRGWLYSIFVKLQRLFKQK